MNLRKGLFDHYCYSPDSFDYISDMGTGKN